jgi:hypothetical protein
MNVPTLTIATAIVFILTYAGIALGRIPGFRLDRAGIALTGAALMMAIGAIAPEEAYRAVNLDTLVLLLGMIIVVAHLRLSGFFRLVTRWALGAGACALALDFARHRRDDRRCVLGVPGQRRRMPGHGAAGDRGDALVAAIAPFRAA